MPLSKDEQRQLEEIERSLLDDDPGLAAAVNGTSRPPASAGLIAFIVGIGVVMVGAVAAETVAAIGLIVSLAGFSAMIAVAAWMISGSTRT